MDKVFSIHVERTFGLQDMQEIVPLLLRLTEQTQKEIKMKLLVVENGSLSLDERNLVENEISSLVDRWNSKVQKLGGHPKGLWLADFDNGTGFFCWKYPETEIRFWHGYKDGFSNRKEVLSRQ